MKNAAGFPLVLGGFLAKSASRSRPHRNLLTSASPLMPPRLATMSPVATLSETVYRAFKRDIIHGVYQHGEALGEKELAERFKGTISN